MFSLRNIIIGLIGISAVAAGVIFAMPVSTSEFARVDIGNTSVSAEVVRTMLQKMKGLGDRAGLPEFGGMLFIMEKRESDSIWMKDMHFPIDIFWIRNGMVVDLEENAPPPAPGAPDSMLPVYKPDSAADLILETNAGFAKKHDIVIGSSVKIFFKDRVAAGGNQTDAGSGNTAAADALSPYSIEALRHMPLEGGNLRIEKLREEKNGYKTYQIRYASDGLEISGAMNVPSGPVPKGGFSVLIMNHGISKPEQYVTGGGLLREEDFFARNGYVTVHPDYRGYPNSSPNPDPHDDLYAGYTRDVMNLIDALEKHPFDFVDPARVGMFGQGMGGAIASRVMLLMPRIRGFVLVSPLSAPAEDDFYFKDVSAPVQIHHGIEDTEVLVDFSKKMHHILQTSQKHSELFLYQGKGHDLGEQWPVAMERSLQFFDYYVRK